MGRHGYPPECGHRPEIVALRAMIRTAGPVVTIIVDDQGRQHGEQHVSKIMIAQAR
ncbi:hypothetical protein [Pseudonocardia sp. NPDC046786]|uniref:hypothetical protein n=1 Tax=Pseudonocardia sp. NPDC046786 TaxID=3155471 RepID=UPI0033CF35A0